MRRCWIVGLFLTAVAGCGDSVVGPEQVSGQYVIKSFAIVVNGITSEMVSRGATVSLRLNPDLTTSGHMTMPAVPGVQLIAIDDDLTGTYAVHNGIVRLTQGTAYLDGLAFTADPPELRAFISLNDGTRTGTFTLVLIRQ